MAMSSARSTVENKFREGGDSMGTWRVFSTMSSVENDGSDGGVWGHLRPIQRWSDTLTARGRASRDLVGIVVWAVSRAHGRLFTHRETGQIPPLEEGKSAPDYFIHTQILPAI